jgi:hypothetical protein
MLHKEPFSQRFIFFITYEWYQYARVLNYTKLERLASDKHFSLLGPFISYKENEVFLIDLRGLTQPYHRYLLESCHEKMLKMWHYVILSTSHDIVFRPIVVWAIVIWPNVCKANSVLANYCLAICC